ncbi:MAG TPA: DUF1553 domain-containing protein, partial [Planctomycetota bacterium]|nr:DUF1553 domain-containing protein [Planctomycetota bacterium]
VHSTQITKNEVEKHRYDEMDDMLATVGTSMLGLSIGCARCHDHKFDPIPQADYYRLLATFTTTVRSEVDVNIDPEGYRKAKAAFDREHEPFEAALEKFDREELPARLAAWEKARPPLDASVWTILDVAESKSEGGAAFTKLEDGSLLASGKNATHDTHTFVAHTEGKRITHVRLEALPDPSLVKGGPGRAKNGNFALTSFLVTAAPRSGGSGPGPVKLEVARATFEQAGLPAAAAIDLDPNTAWAIDPQFGKAHAVIFETGADVGFEGGTTLTFKLEFKNNEGHQIGRSRLSTWSRDPSGTAQPPGLDGDSIPENVLAALAKPRESRTEAENAALLQWYRGVDPERRRLAGLAEEHRKIEPRPPLVKALISTEGLQAVRLHTQGDDFFNETYFLRRGDVAQKEGPATQGFLQVLMAAPEKERRWQAAPPEGSRTSHRRAALARWLTDPADGAGGLLARVIVNRLWQHYMGRGIVATSSDFGTRGEPPTHPELLDYLARELIRGGWRLKPIHALILSSAVYRQGPAADASKAGEDPDGRLYSGRSPRRLEAEAIRDAVLFVSGMLDTRMYGPGTLDEGHLRRSIYFTVKRSQLIPMMQVFDGPDALQGMSERPTTTIAPQALLLMNNANIRRCAVSFARSLLAEAGGSLEGAVKRAHAAAFGRTPGAEEMRASMGFLAPQIASHAASGASDSTERGFSDFCQALISSSEFVHVE